MLETWDARREISKYTIKTKKEYVAKVGLYYIEALKYYKIDVFPKSPEEVCFKAYHKSCLRYTLCKLSSGVVKTN